MKITASIVFAQLPQAFHPRANKPNFTDRGLRAPLLYSHELMYPDYMYICRGEELSESDMQFSTIVCIGSPGFDVQASHSDIIIIDADTSISVLFNQIQLIFQDLTEWDRELYAVASTDMNIQDLFIIGRKQLDFVMVLLDKQFRRIAARTSSSLVRNVSESGSALIDTVISDRRVSDKLPQSEVVIFDEPNSGCTVISYNIYYNNDFRAKLLALRNSTQPVSAAERQLFLVFAQYFDRMYERYAVSPMRTSAYENMQKIISSLVFSTDDFSKKDIAEALRDTQWKANDCYTVFFIPYDENGELAVKAAFFCTLLENRWNHVRSGSNRAVITEEGIIWVVNNSKPVDVPIKDFYKEFGEILKANGARAGASNFCYNFLELRTYYRQAVVAANIGTMRAPEKNVYRFKEYALDYMLEHAVGEFEYSELIAGSLVKLSHYDEREHTEFFKTLRLFFLYKYNATQTADALFIHRSTFSARIKRIEEICGFDLEDERTRLNVLLSFYLLERNSDGEAEK